MMTFTLTLPTPRNNSEIMQQAAAQKKAEDALSNLDFVLWPEGNGKVTVDSWKTVNGRRTFDRYEVDLKTGTCTCKSYEQRRYCKHGIAAFMAANAEIKTEAEACGMDAELYLKWEERAEWEREFGFAALYGM